MKYLTPQEQLAFACKLARANEHERIAFVCPSRVYFEIQHGLEDCTLNVMSRRINFANGASIHFIDPVQLENRVTEFAGYQLTQIFYVDGVRLSYPTKEFFESRQRSTKIKTPLKQYHAWGATWREYEYYGS